MEVDHTTDLQRPTRSAFGVIGRGGALAMLLVSNVFACGDEDAPAADSNADAGNAASQPDATSEPQAGAAGSGEAGAGAEPPLYALMTHVFDDTTASAYLTLLDSLEEREDIDLSEAREFPGWSIPGGFERRLFVSSSEAPEVSRYSIGSRGNLEDERTLSFAGYTSGIASLNSNYFIDEATALMTLDQTTRVLWDPSALAIRGETDSLPVELMRDGMTVAAHARGAVVRGGGVIQSYYWHDDDWYAFHPQSQIAFYDTQDASLETLIDAPCPALHRASADEDGNVYLSPLGDLIAYQLLDEEAPESCMVRVNAGEQEIAAGWPRNLAELTEGRPTGEFSYLKDGLGVLSVYHAERASITPDTEPAELIVADNWRLWLVDVDAWEAQPIEDLDWLAGGTHLSTVDERAFLFTSSSDFSTTTIYEVSTDSRVTRLFSTPGYAEDFVKVR